MRSCEAVSGGEDALLEHRNLAGAKGYHLVCVEIRQLNRLQGVYLTGHQGSNVAAAQDADLVPCEPANLRGGDALDLRRVESRKLRGGVSGHELNKINVS